MRSNNGVVIVAACLVLTACASAPPMGLTTFAPEPAVVSVVGIATDTIVVAGADASQLAGTVIGGNYDGMLKVKQSNKVLQAADVNHLNTATRNAAAQELAAAGYAVVTPSEMFSGVQQYGGARYVLAGKVLQMEFNEYARLAGGYKTFGIALTWELFDAVTRRVVFTKTTAARSTLANEADVFTPAMQSVVHQLLGDPSFVTAVTRSHAVAKSESTAPDASGLAAQPNVVWPSALPGESAIIRIRSADARLSTKPRLYDRVADAVVSIETSMGSGSGFFITRNGYALTNHHVVVGAREIGVRLASGARMPARVVRSDSAFDVAVIQVACATACTTLDWEERLPAEGTEVYAVGNPLGQELARSVTKGIVSGVRRIGSRSLIQTDAAINPGNSGGPLVDVSSGRVVGIVSSKLTGRSLEGLGFAIPVSDALRVLGMERQR